MPRIHTVLLLDKSGSMGRVRQVTLDGINEFLQSARADEGVVNSTVSLFTFSTKVTEVAFMKSPKDVADLTLEDYVPGGDTSMYDAITYAVLRLRYSTNVSPDDTFMVTVFTDGQENSSTLRRPENLRDLVVGLEAGRKWVFSFVGANVDLADVCRNTGVRAVNSIAYVPTAQGTADALGSVSASRSFTARGLASTGDLPDQVFVGAGT